MFWHLNPKKIEKFREAYVRNADWVGWLNGQYVCAAIANCFAKSSKYPKQPHSFEQAKNENSKPLTDAERFGAFALAFNKGFKNKNK